MSTAAPSAPADPRNTAAPLMLGVSGLRGISGASLTPELASRYAAVIGSYLVERAGSPASGWNQKTADALSLGKPVKARVRVVLGFDGRIGGEAWYHAASAGLRSAGCDVAMLGVAMTPTMGVAVDAAGADAGIQITASHNPQQWNGLKLLLRTRGLAPGKADACAPPKAVADEIVSRFREGRFTLRPWDQMGLSVGAGEGLCRDHLRVVQDLLKSLGCLPAIRRRKFAVVLDSVNGSGASLGVPFLADAMACRVTSLGADAGRPFWHTPEPVAANLAKVAASVRKARAAVGFCQDPDADRLALIDENGRYIGEEYTLVLAAMALAEFGLVRKGSTMAVNLSTSRMLEDVAASRGATVLRTAVGEANVVEAMKARRCVLGGEGNGGVIWPGVTYIRDSLAAMGLVLALMAKTRKTLSELVSSTPAYAIEKRKVDLARKEDAMPSIDKLRAAYAGQRIDLQDGIRIDFVAERSWLHVRASNTEPIMRLIAEAPEPSVAARILDDAAAVIAS